MSDDHPAAMDVDAINEGDAAEQHGTIEVKDPRKCARNYQLELCRRALEGNVIVYLETGCGKTHIAILLMYEMGHLIKKPQKDICVFLAPTVALVNQQASVIQEHTDFKVGSFSGDDKCCSKHKDWDKVLEHFEVLVMTPIILYTALCHRFIKLEMITLLIFDECHYAQVESNHPYAAIMKEFYNERVAKLPRVFGMTASPVLGRGGSVDGLEALLHAKVCSVKDKEELEKYVSSPVIKVYYYLSSKGDSSKDIFLGKLKKIKEQSMEMLHGRTDDYNNVMRIKKLLHKLYNNMEFCLGALGICGVLQASHILLNGDQVDRKELIGGNDNSTDNGICIEFLNQITSFCRSYCERDGAESALSSLEVFEEPFFSHKTLLLIQILSNFRSRNDMKCIIFVNRIIVARSLCCILQRLKILSSWKCGYLVGIHSKVRRTSRRTMNDILDRFRSGELNLLIATKVGEEGLDIRTCCLVIRFDLPETLASFIQSRGRARMLQSEFVLLVNGENEKEVNIIEKFKKEENEMNLHIINRNSSDLVANFEVEVYRVDSTGASISLQSSVTLLHHYCSKLPRDEYFDPHPQFFYINDVEGTICHIILPANAPMHQVASTPQSSMEAAKKNACLKACQQLHKLGALTDYLLPDVESYKDECLSDMSDSDSEDDSSRSELHEMIVPAILTESWLGLDKPVCLNSYFISFTPEPLDRKYKEFCLFLKAPLPREAERMELNLHLSHGRSVMTQLVPSGVKQFNEEEILLAQKFQEMFLKIILDRSKFVANVVPLGSNISCELRSSMFYLLLPVIPHDHQGMMTVDWKVISKCLSSPIFNASSELGDHQNSSGGSLKLVDGPESVNNILNSLVYVAHKKSFFFVSELLPEKNAYSSHNASHSHVKYLFKAHGIQLSYPEQPLLRVKQLFCLHNLLHDRKKGVSEIRELEEHFFELPPELCQMKILGFSKEIGSSISLLPSLMHRLENLLVAIELKNRLSASFPEGALVTAERVLEALTTEKCNERFSLERLEVLGDAFLKFAVGRHLFLRYDAIDEGQLTRRRSRIVNNSNLYKIAIRSKLQVYIRDEEFDPSQFFAFGRPCTNICTDELEQSIHPVFKPSSPTNGNAWPQKCSKNHHWLYKKTMADVVEALVGAYIVDSGFKAATAFLRWIGIKVDFEASKVHLVGVTSATFMPLSSRIDIPLLEEKMLKHKFQHKGLLLQAFVHPSYNRHNGGCYQRLEFLGDAVLDYLITSFLYSGFPKLKPGQLTDLRSVLVNNSTFAKIAIKHSFHTNILCDSHNLCDAIEKYVMYIEKLTSGNSTLEEPKCPKALGDLVESCFGAILLDTGFNLNLMWRKMFYFLSPVMKFTNLQVNPFRELTELCQYHKWDLQFISVRKNKCCTTEAKVEGEVEGKLCCWSATATCSNGKLAKKMASEKLFEILQAEGYRVKSKSLEEILRESPRDKSVLIGYDEDPVYSVSPDSLEFESLSLEDPSSSEITVSPDALRSENLKLDPSSSERTAPGAHYSKYKESMKSDEHKLKPSALKPVQKIPKLKKSVGASHQRTAKSLLHEVCLGNCWLPPVFECCNEQGPSHLRQFTYKVMLEIDEANVEVECQGEPHLKKKVAAEHAAEGALWLLRKEGYI
ncbi:hypothetical protein V2J09_010241 [Rumex salicifolius]